MVVVVIIIIIIIIVVVILIIVVIIIVVIISVIIIFIVIVVVVIITTSSTPLQQYCVHRLLPLCHHRYYSYSSRADRRAQEKEENIGFSVPGRPKRWRSKAFKVLDESVSNRLNLANNKMNICQESGNKT